MEDRTKSKVMIHKSYCQIPMVTEAGAEIPKRRDFRTAACLDLRVRPFLGVFRPCKLVTRKARNEP